MVAFGTDHSIWCRSLSWENRFFVGCILQTHISRSPPKFSALPSQLKVALTCLPVSSSPLWSQTSSLSVLLRWSSTWVSAHIVNLSKLDVIQWFSNLVKMQIWASLILLQVHGSEDKGKTNLIRIMRLHRLFLAHFAALSDNSLYSSLPSAPQICLLVLRYICMFVPPWELIPALLSFWL